MRTNTRIPSSNTVTPRTATPAQAGPRELQWAELTQVSGGLPKGGWAASVTAAADRGPLSVEAPPAAGGHLA